MLSIKNLQVHLQVALQQDLKHPQVLVAFPPQADLHLVAAVSPVVAEALVAVGAVGVGKAII